MTDTTTVSRRSIAAGRRIVDDRRPLRAERGEGRLGIAAALHQTGDKSRRRGEPGQGQPFVSANRSSAPPFAATREVPPDRRSPLASSSRWSDRTRLPARDQRESSSGTRRFAASFITAQSRTSRWTITPPIIIVNAQLHGTRCARRGSGAAGSNARRAWPRGTAHRRNRCIPSPVVRRIPMRRVRRHASPMINPSACTELRRPVVQRGARRSTEICFGRGIHYVP